MWAAAALFALSLRRSVYTGFQSCRMGGSSSKQQTSLPAAESAEVINSSGMHLIEVHAPTAGFNVIVLLGVMLACVAGWAVYKRRRASKRRKRAERGGGRHHLSSVEDSRWPSSSPFAPFERPDQYAAVHLAAGQALYGPQAAMRWQRPVQWQAPPAVRPERRIADLVEMEEVPPAIQEVGRPLRGAPVPEGV